MSKIELRLESPLMVGGKRLKDNVLESLDYMPGSVMRAAFAKYILLNCPLYIPDKCDECGRFNYVYIRDNDKCRECTFYDCCSNFSNIKFSFFYPKDFEIIPFTSRKCKSYDEHGFIDMLIPPKNLRCKRCIEKNKGLIADEKVGRLDSARGFRIGEQCVKVEREVFTRTSVDPYTLTAKEGSLYSLYAVKPGITFTGEIDGFEILNLKAGSEIYVGSYNTVGFGRFRIENISEEHSVKDMYNDILKFNERIKDTAYGHDKTYIPMLFVSDAKLGIEKYNFDKPLSNEKYKAIWKRLLFTDEMAEFEVEKVFSEQGIYRGYDTSRKWGSWEKDPQVLVLKGTTILASTIKPISETIGILNKLQDEGIGLERENGFGKVEVCNELHVKGEI